MIVYPPIRGTDNHGSGHYGASRGSRTHRGVDLAMYPKSSVCTDIDGTCTKLGYPYGDDLNFRYVELTSSTGQKFRYFYVNPEVEVGDYLLRGQVIGTSQKLGDRYPGITEHIHFEIIDTNSEYLDPTSYVI